MLIGLTLVASVILAQAPDTTSPRRVPPPDCRKLMLAPVAGSPALCQAIDILRTGNAEADADRKRQQLQAAAELFSRATTQL